MGIFDKGTVKPTAPNPQTPAKDPDSLTWIKIARGELGEKEIPGSRDNPQIIDYHHTTTGQFDDDETPWCSSFVNWVMIKAGFKGTNNALAISWMNWGVACEAKPGAICVMSRPGGNHVNFVLEVHNDYLMCIGGNQSNAVTIAKYEKSRVKGYRWPKV